MVHDFQVEIQRRKREPIPAGWALDKHGNVTTSPDEAMESNSLLPLGGTEVNSGYKGYGLAVVVDLFCGILGGPHIYVQLTKHLMQN